tara:strand:- start:383 stop:775 length:393 start_codon:yes stop_codon:yes gene_type:complete
MFKTKKIWYIICAVIVVLILFRVFYRKKEGLEPRESSGENLIELPSKIKGAVNDVESSLLLANHKGDYEDIIIGLNDSVDYQILKTIKAGGENISKDATSEESFKTIRKINELRNLKTALHESMSFLDSK